MRVISQSPDPLARMHTMTDRKGKSGTIDVKALLTGDEGFLRALVRTALQEVLEVEMTEAGRREERADGGLSGLPFGLLQPDADHPDRQARAARAAGSRGPVLDRTVRALSTLGASAGGGAGRDVRARRFDAQG